MGFGGGPKSTSTAQQAADGVHKRWAALVDQRLRRTRQRYKEAMRVDVAPGVITLRLADKFANMLEFGAGPWDLRTTLLKNEGSSGAWPKRSATGHLYRPIFFATGTTQIQAWGGWSAYRKKAISLSPSVRRAGGTTWGEKLPKGLAPKLAKHHATDPLHGLYRMKEGPGGRAYYGTFRMISWGSKAWTHPGFKGEKLMQEAVKGVGSNVIARIRRG